MTTYTGVNPMPPKPSRLTPSREETLMDLLVKFSGDESGASAVEYSLLLLFITMAIVAAVKTFGATVRGFFDLANARYPTVN
jgi:Flp pilus assembly pilin Flp